MKFSHFLIIGAISILLACTQTNQKEKQQDLAQEKSSTSMKKVSFKSQDAKLIGHLFLPPNFDPSKKYSAIIVDGSWTTVKEQMQGLYAKAIADKGYITLAFDHKYYGESEGQPREYEDHAVKVQDIKDALTYLESLEYVDNSRLGGLGVCASGAYMLNAAAEDSRIKSMATVAAWLMTPETAKLFYGGDEGVADRIAKASAARDQFNRTGEANYVSAYDPNNPEAAMFFPVDYYAKKERGAVPSWNNNFAVMSWDRWLTYDGIVASKSVTIPVIMIHSDKAFLPDGVKAAYANLQNKKSRAEWMNEYEHTQFYDDPKTISKAVDSIVKQFNETL
ncbi:MAG: alpha/beta hydrolase [Bacteroidota bacterium]